MASERPYFSGTAMGGVFSCRTVMFGVGSGPLVWSRVAAWVMRSTQAWLTNKCAQTNCFVDDPIILLKGTSAQRRKLAMGVLLWWASLGLKPAYEKGSFGPEAVWIGTHLVINAKANKIEIRLPAKKNLEILAILVDLMDGPGSTMKHDEVRKLAGKESWVGQHFQAVHREVYKRQVWPALSWLRMFHEHRRGDLVRHLFLVDQTLDGLVWSTRARLEVERHVGMAIEADRVASRAFVTTEWTTEDESLLFTKRGDPAHQATWEAFMALLAIRHFVTPKARGRIILVGDALGVWYGLVRMKARATKVNEIAKELALHLVPLGHELAGIHVWSEVNVLEDALSRIGNRTTVPKGLRHVRRETLRSWGPPDWVCLGTLQDIM